MAEPLSIGELVGIFNSIRDIPYRIPLALDDTSIDCMQKHQLLARALSEKGYDVRFRACSFLWSAMAIPPEILNIEHVDRCEHLFLEILIEGRWVVLDATWDSGLRGILPVNEWDGKSDTKIAVEPLSVYPEPKETLVHFENEEAILEDLRTSGAFYAAFNVWLDKTREKAKES